MIHEHEGRFSISSHQVWRPGCYESKAAANYAFRFADEVLAELQREAIAKTDGIIRYSDLQEARGKLIAHVANLP